MKKNLTEEQTHESVKKQNKAFRKGFLIAFILFFLIIAINWEILIWISILLIYIGIPYFIYRAIKEKNHWVSVTLILVYAFIIFFTWAVFKMEKSYISFAKIESTKTNHSNIEAFIDASFKKCSAGSTLITLGNKKVFCNSDSIASSFATYFNTVHVNTYINSFPSIVLSNGTIPALGSSNINYSDNTMTIITNVGDEGGGNVYINATIVRKK